MVRFDSYGMAYDDNGNPMPEYNRVQGVPIQQHSDMHGFPRVNTPRVSKREILTVFQQQKGSQELELVDDAGADYARHVCQNGNKVYLLPKKVCPFQTPQGVINIIYYRCEVCGKLIVDNNFM